MPAAFPLVMGSWLPIVSALCLGSLKVWHFISYIPCLEGDFSLGKNSCLELHAFPELENISCSMSPGF